MPSMEIQQFPLWERLKSQHTPLSFSLEVTARCNHDCRHCYINRPARDQQAQASELSTAEILNLAGQAVRCHAVWCLITGGEPLLRPDFPDIYLGLKQLGLLVSVFTNATLLTPEHAALFSRYPPRTLEVTIYGVTRETYEAVTRKPGSFAAFQRGLELLFEQNLRVRLKAMILQSNLHEQAAIAAFGRAHTQDYYRFDPQLHLRLDGDARRNAEIRAERLTPEQIVALERADVERQTEVVRACADLPTPSHARADLRDLLFHCNVGRGSFSIGYDGTFRLCSSLCAPGATANLREEPLAEVWQRLPAAILALRSSREEHLRTCCKCNLMNLCLWCPANAHLETGELDAPTPYFCAVAHARAQAFGNADAPMGFADAH